MSGLRGDIRKLRRFEQALRELPRVVGIRVAARAAGEITDLARATFRAGENAFGDAWAPGSDGQRVTLRETGRLAAGVAYVADGTRLRARLGPGYAKYQVGRRPVFPRNGARLPTAYVDTLRATASEVIREELGAT